MESLQFKVPIICFWLNKEVERLLLLQILHGILYGKLSGRLGCNQKSNYLFGMLAQIFSQLRAICFEEVCPMLCRVDGVKMMLRLSPMPYGNVILLRKFGRLPRFLFHLIVFHLYVLLMLFTAVSSLLLIQIWRLC